MRSPNVEDKEDDDGGSPEDDRALDSGILVHYLSRSPTTSIVRWDTTNPCGTFDMRATRDTILPHTDYASGKP